MSVFRNEDPTGSRQPINKIRQHVNWNETEKKEHKLLTDWFYGFIWFFYVIFHF